MIVPKVKVQINTSGAWRDVLTFEAPRQAEVVAALAALAAAIEHRASFCLVHEGGKREWLRQT